MDNLGSHKGKAIRRLIRAAGAKLIFLPKYSPDLNPIEQVFAKLKHLLRKIAAHTVDDVCAALGQILAAFTPDECANYFKNSGSELRPEAATMKFKEERPFANPEAAMAKLLEISNALEADHAGRISVGAIIHASAKLEPSHFIATRIDACA
jgi:hypothetical protein